MLSEQFFIYTYVIHFSPRPGHIEYDDFIPLWTIYNKSLIDTLYNLCMPACVYMFVCSCVVHTCMCLCVCRVLNQRGKSNHDVVVMIKNSENEDGEEEEEEGLYATYAMLHTIRKE